MENKKVIELRKDCFGYKNAACTVLTTINCHGCHFYKLSGTECDTCPHKGDGNYTNHCRSRR